MNLYIDSDSILYRASHLAGKDNDTDLAEQNVDDEAEDIELGEAVENGLLPVMSKIFHSMADEIVREVRAKHEIEEVIYVLTVKPKLGCCSGMDDNFRYTVMANVPDEAVKGYKSNRAGMEVPEGLNAIYEYVYNLPQTICVSGVEADDVCVHYGQNGHMVAALDKDVLGSLAEAYNYGRKEWIEHTPEEIKKFPYLQTIMGDTSDGLRGVYRVGLKGAEKALLGLETDRDLWIAVLKQYGLKNQTLDEAVATMRCVRMDMWTPTDGLVDWLPPRGDTNGTV